VSGLETRRRARIERAVGKLWDRHRDQAAGSITSSVTGLLSRSLAVCNHSDLADRPRLRYALEIDRCVVDAACTTKRLPGK